MPLCVLARQRPARLHSGSAPRGESLGTDSLHELRKRVKDLWYAAQVARPAAPKQMKRIARRAHALSDLIGDDHDLAILGQRAGERRDCFEEEAAVGELTRLIERRREELQRDAMELGERLYRKKPGKLVRPLEQAHVAA